MATGTNTAVVRDDPRIRSPALISRFFFQATTMNEFHNHFRLQTRRYFLQRSGVGLGAVALASILNEDAPALAQGERLNGLPHFAAKAKRVIYLFQSGAPSQLDLLDYKPKLHEARGTDLPDSVRKGQRLTGMTAYQAKFPTAPSIFKFSSTGPAAPRLSEL